MNMSRVTSICHHFSKIDLPGYSRTPVPEAGVTLAKLTGRPSNAASDAYHLYFVSVLEQVLEVLAP
jgi:hypothetical protein